MSLLSKALRNPIWLINKLVLWCRSYLMLGRKDVVLAFFPKTGSTWVRIFLFHLLSKRGGQADFTFDDVNRVMPEWGHASFFKKWPYQGCPKLVKVHRAHNFLFANQKTILFTRDPRDTMLSYLHYANAKHEYAFSGGLVDLLLHPEMGADAYFKFHHSWIPQAGLVVRYEDLRSNPVATFGKLLEYIGISASDLEIEQALEASSLENTRSAQVRSSSKFKGKFDEDFIFARSGSTGEGATFFDADSEEILARKMQEWSFGLYK